MFPGGTGGGAGGNGMNGGPAVGGGGCGIMSILLGIGGGGV